MNRRLSQFTDQPWVPGLFSGVHGLASLGFLGFTIFALSGLQFLSFDDDLKNLFKGDSKEYTEFEKYTNLFGVNDSQCVALLSAPNVLDVQSLKVLRSIDSAVRENEKVERVSSLCDLLLPKRVGRMFFSVVPFENAEDTRWRSAQDYLVNHPLGMGVLYSQDCRHTIVTFELKKGLERGQSELEIEKIKKTIRKLWLEQNLFLRQEVSATADFEPEIGFTGLPIIRNEVTVSLQRDQKKFTILGLLFSLVIGWFLLKKPL
ncbi:MAG: hypothetical protein VX438_13905, partial [Planctomycetota bacterium]|nr:hypothetical protein [Planctomycetota bacterium]